MGSSLILHRVFGAYVYDFWGHFRLSLTGSTNPGWSTSYPNYRYLLAILVTLIQLKAIFIN